MSAVDDRVAEVARAVHRRLLEQGPGRAAPVGGAPMPDGALRALALEVEPLLPDALLALVAERVRSLVCGLGPLDPLLADDDVSEVMANPDGSVWVERSGRLERTAVALRPREVLGLIERVTAPLGLQVDRRHPMVDARLPDGARVHAVIPPLAVDGPCLTIRRFRARHVPLGDLAAPVVAAALERSVHDRRNIVVSGGTSAGKTTLLNALAGCLPLDQRVVTIEDTAELRLPGEHVIRLESRPARAEGVAEVPVAQLVRAALRMRPDRIVVGEVRGGEALAMVQAMNTGHDGSLSTCHANSPLDALRRLETMVLAAGSGLPLAAIRQQLVGAVDLVVQVRRLDGGRRGVVAVDEVLPELGPDGCQTRPLFRHHEQLGAARRPPRWTADDDGGRP